MLQFGSEACPAQELGLGNYYGICLRRAQRLLNSDYYELKLAESVVKYALVIATRGDKCFYMQRSCSAILLEIIAAIAMIILLLYVLFGPPS